MQKQELSVITNDLNKSLITQFKLLVKQIQHKIDNDTTLDSKQKIQLNLM